VVSVGVKVVSVRVRDIFKKHEGTRYICDSTFLWLTKKGNLSRDLYSVGVLVHLSCTTCTRLIWSARSPPALRCSSVQLTPSPASLAFVWSGAAPIHPFPPSPNLRAHRGERTPSSVRSVTSRTLDVGLEQRCMYFPFAPRGSVSTYRPRWQAEAGSGAVHPRARRPLGSAEARIGIPRPSTSTFTA
jgi:hypothetical protein